jgi:hypothetical protein
MVLDVWEGLAEWTGLEPATPGVTGRYSNQLNYHSRLADLPLATSMMRSRSSTPTYPCATGDRTLEQPQWRELQGSNSRPTPLWVSLARQPAIVHEQTRASARPERSGCGPPTAGRHQPDRPPLRASGALGDACAQGRFAAPRTKSPRRVSRPRARGPRFFSRLGEISPVAPAPGRGTGGAPAPERARWSPTATTISRCMPGYGNGCA